MPIADTLLCKYFNNNNDITRFTNMYPTSNENFPKFCHRPQKVSKLRTFGVFAGLK